MYKNISSTRCATCRHRKNSRRGAITVLAAVLSIVLLGMVAFCVDIGYVLSMREEMQRTADSAALAACWDYGNNLGQGNDATVGQQSARAQAQLIAGGNSIGAHGPLLDMNSVNSPTGDVVFGYINDPTDPNSQFDPNSPQLFNAVRLRVRRDSTLNGEAPTFFAKIFGHGGIPLYANATAALIRDVQGFKIPNNAGSINILPFTLDLPTWEDWMAETGTEIKDDWTWDNKNNRVVPGSDTHYEVNLYPKGNGSPGNRGTVDIGSSNNSTSDIERQILHGVSAADLAYHNGALELDSNRELTLNGDTGISAGVKDELTAIIGQPRIIPIFSHVRRPGNNAQYTIVKWMGIRIMDVRLTGPEDKKYVMIQACPVKCEGIIPATTPGTSRYVYSPVALVE